MNKFTVINDSDAPSDLFEKGIKAGEQRAFDKILIALRGHQCDSDFRFFFVTPRGSDYAQWLEVNRQRILK